MSRYNTAASPSAITTCFKSLYHKGRLFCLVMLLGLQAIRDAAPRNICISPANTREVLSIQF